MAYDNNCGANDRSWEWKCAEPVVGAIRRMSSLDHELYKNAIQNRDCRLGASRRLGQLGYPETLYHTDCLNPPEGRLVRYGGRPWDGYEMYPYLWTDVEKCDMGVLRPNYNVRLMSCRDI